jgi:uncharacterized protein YecE (DUF72 family)
LLKAFAGYTLAVELRIDRGATRRTPLNCSTTIAPRGCRSTNRNFPSSIRQDLKGPLAELYYLRLHGRNAKEWWDQRRVRDRYNYFYSAEELAADREQGPRRPRDGERRRICS